MKFPTCNSTDLLMTERSCIEIDYCPQCRGVWLDCGELDKIIERSMGEFVKKTPISQALHQTPRNMIGVRTIMISTMKIIKATMKKIHLERVI